MALHRRHFLDLLAVLPFLPRRAPRTDSAPCWELDRFFIAGFRYHEGPALIDRLRPGDALAVRAEPDNPHDPGAIRLEFAGRHIGYVPRAQNDLPGRLLSQGASLVARIEAVAPTADGWEAVEVAILLPRRGG